MLQVNRLIRLTALYVLVVSILLSCGGDDSASEAAIWMNTKQLGAAGTYTYGYSVTTDRSDNVYVAGRTYGDLDGNTLSGVEDSFVTMYDSSGVKQFTRQLGDTGAYTSGNSIATDSNGNVYVVGYTNGDLDGNMLIGTYDCFVTKYDSSGAKQYTHQLGAAGSVTGCNAVTTDNSDNVYVAGYTDGNLDGNTLSGASDFFVTKYDSGGVKQFTRQLGVTGAFTPCFSIATDIDSNLYVAGRTNGDLDGNTLSGVKDFFVTKYDSSGAKQYTRQLGVTGAETVGNSVAVDANGSFYIAGYTNGDLDGNTLIGTTDFFVTKYNSSGVKQYTQQLGVVGAETVGNAVATDSSGYIYVAGYTYGSLDGNILSGGADFFITKYENSGTKQYTRQHGISGAWTFGHSVTTDDNGNTYVVGQTSGGLDGNFLSGIVDFFVTKYDSNGGKK